MRANRLTRLPLLLLYTLSAIGAPEQHGAGLHPLGVRDAGQKPLLHSPKSPDTLPAFLDALDVLQEDYFALWQGLYPSGIDWTSAVIGTYVSASLSTISSSFSSLSSSKSKENLVNKYFSQLTAYYFGQDAFALRQEAYDDMLWVVLGWLESIKFIKQHSAQHYPHELWYGTQWIPSFAHRARLFWDLASAGWDTSLCNGGMVWSPYLEPYKNAITNELFISASISMYLYFPGDTNTSPFSSSPDTTSIAIPPARAKDPKYLAAAIEAYKWLRGANMTDSHGLYVDGYHISGYTKNHSRSTSCDARNEMVYTYNQGVLLSGQRGLYEATGARSYLEDGHGLIKDVLGATGWDLKAQAPIKEKRHANGTLAKWRGLGRGGVMEDTCDSSAICSQDGQTFKGIFFHHLTLFCSHLPTDLAFQSSSPSSSPASLAEVRKWHDKQCKRYGPWIRHNAKAALETRDAEGRYGMWWGAPKDTHERQGRGEEVPLPDQAVDYRNLGVPRNWTEPAKHRHEHKQDLDIKRDMGSRDPNERGRGRTVETQGGGVAVLRALWEIVDTR